MTIQQKYQERCNQVSDIYQHLPTLHNYAKECKRITEMGVRSVVSTWAFLAAKPDRLTSIDLEYSENIEKVVALADIEHIDFDFVKADVLTIEIEPTDLLFIDTWHTYTQLKQELALHASKAAKYIILHDTVTFGHIGEDGKDKGLLPAVYEFLAANEMWYLKEQYNNNNGLTVLAKYPV